MGHVAHGGHGAAVHVRGVLQVGRQEVSLRAGPLPLSAGTGCHMALPLFICEMGGPHLSYRVTTTVNWESSLER